MTNADVSIDTVKVQPRHTTRGFNPTSAVILQHKPFTIFSGPNAYGSIADRTKIRLLDVEYGAAKNCITVKACVQNKVVARAVGTATKATKDQVVAITTRNVISTTRTDNRVIASTTVDEIITCCVVIAANRIGAVAHDEIIAVITINGVITATAVDLIIAGLRVKLVTTSAAVNCIFFIASNNLIVTTKAQNDVLIASRSKDAIVSIDLIPLRVGCVVDVNRVVTVRAFNKTIQATGIANLNTFNFGEAKRSCDTTIGIQKLNCAAFSCGIIVSVGNSCRTFDAQNINVIPASTTINDVARRAKDDVTIITSIDSITAFTCANFISTSTPD